MFGSEAVKYPEGISQAFVIEVGFCGFLKRLVFEPKLCFPKIHENIYILYYFACKYIFYASTNIYCGMLQLVALYEYHMIEYIETSK